jgi:sulfite reductase alpha subunit-like flavoprotein
MNGTTATASSKTAAAANASRGVEIVRTLLQLQSPTDNKGDSTTFVLPTVDPSTLPVLTRQHVSSCELVAHNVDDEDRKNKNAQDISSDDLLKQRPRGMSLSGQSVSTTSSGFYYTYQRPWQSKILSARYLTATKIPPPLASTFSSAGKSNDDAGNIESLLDLYDQHYVPADKERRVLEVVLHLPTQNGDDNDDHTQHLLEYEPGDSLGLVVENPPSSVQFVLNVLAKQGLDSQQSILLANEDFTAQEQQGENRLSSSSSKPPAITVEQAVRTKLDLSTPVVPKRVLYAFAQNITAVNSNNSSHEEEAKALRLLSSKSREGCQLYQEYVEQQRVTVVDILKDFPSAQSIPWKSLLGILSMTSTSIPPRYYSVSSSPLALPNALTMAFSVVDYTTPSLIGSNGTELGKRRIRGVATRYLEAMVSPLLLLDSPALTTGSGGDSSTTTAPFPLTLSIFPKPTTDFRMPASLQIPLILIGPGTGIAPFIGFLQHRRALWQQSRQAQQEAAKTVVEGTWRGGYEVEEHELPVTAQRDGILMTTTQQLQQLLQVQPPSTTNSTTSTTDQTGQQQQQQPLESTAIGSVDVYFGCRHEHHDWLYRDEMLQLKSEGIITNLYTAFSRDGRNSSDKKDDREGNNHSNNNDQEQNRRYVQHVMRQSENSTRLVDLILRQRAHVYLCGDGNSMAKDVQAAFVEILGQQLPGSVEEAKLYLERMKQERRFLMDIWS